MFWEFIQKIPEFLHFTVADLAKVLIGAFMVGFMAVGWVRSIRKATKAQVRAEEHRRAAEAEKERAEFYRQMSELKSQHAEEVLRLREQVMEAERCRGEAESEREKLAAALASVQQRLSDLESFDGKLWEQEAHVTPPPFVSATDRPTRFISVVNLKGGVGKTTLTANIGVSLARRKHRVLLVDLDFQSSLTRLCKLSSEQLLEFIRKRRTSARLLDGGGDALLVNDLAHGVSHPNLVGQRCDYIAADETLAEAELRAQARWLVSKTPDARFLFRRLFHAPEVLGNYDFVLFDCPPRLTTACVNALGCSDFLLVPVLLEQGSVEALPRTLNWLSRLPHVSRARLLGVVANRVDLYGGKPVSSQQTIYDYLPETLKRCGFGGKEVFRTIVKNQRSLIEQAANQGQIAAATDPGAALFAGVTDEVEKGVRQ
jgi:cellulose biosynthesis protein BcsQ